MLVAAMSEEASTCRDDVVAAEDWIACDAVAVGVGDGTGGDTAGGAGGGGSDCGAGAALDGAAKADDCAAGFPFSDMTEKNSVFDPQSVDW